MVKLETAQSDGSIERRRTLERSLQLFHKAYPIASTRLAQALEFTGKIERLLCITLRIREENAESLKSASFNTPMSTPSLEVALYTGKLALCCMSMVVCPRK